MVEIAMALFLLTVLFGADRMPLQTHVLARKTADSKLLDKAREALLGYASAHGYFPCPATDLSGARELRQAIMARSLCDLSWLLARGAIGAAIG